MPLPLCADSVKWTDEAIINMEKQALAGIGERRGVFAVCEAGLFGGSVLFYETKLHTLIARVREHLGTGELQPHQVSFGFVAPSEDYLPNPKRDEVLKFIRQSWDRKDEVTINILRGALRSGATKRGRRCDPQKNRRLIQQLAKQAQGASSKDVVEGSKCVLEQSDSFRAQSSTFRRQVQLDYLFLGEPDLSQPSFAADHAKRFFAERYGFCFPQDLKALQFALRKQPQQNSLHN